MKYASLNQITMNEALNKVLNSGKTLNKTQREAVKSMLDSAYQNKKEAILDASQKAAEKKFDSELKKLIGDFNKKYNVIVANIKKACGETCYVSISASYSYDYRKNGEMLSYSINARNMDKDHAVTKIPAKIEEIILGLTLGASLKEEVEGLVKEINNIK